jgi:hypothetical protein
MRAAATKNVPVMAKISGELSKAISSGVRGAGIGIDCLRNTLAQLEDIVTVVIVWMRLRWRCSKLPLGELRVVVHNATGALLGCVLC